MSDETDQAGGSPDEGQGAFPDYLAAAWDALSGACRSLICDPWTGRKFNYREATDMAVRMLRHQGWTLEHAIELASFYPEGFGKLGTQGVGIIREAWAEQSAEHAKAEADRLARILLLQRTSAATLLSRALPPDENLLGSLVTRTSRVFFVGSTGAGKTMFGIALACGMASGDGFLQWRSSRPARVLYIDGEMPLRSLQARVADAARRIGDVEALALLNLVSWQDANSLGMGEWAPFNSEAGQQFALALCETIRPDVVVFDNVQSLIAGDMKDEVPWNETWPLIAGLTSRQIGQIWIDHTGHNTTRQYGSSTKAWRFDTVGILTPLPRADCVPGETAFTLCFDAPGKARNRSPETWAEYDTQAIRLRDDLWTTDTPGGRNGHGRVKPSRLPFYDALLASMPGTTPGETTLDAWEACCVHRGLIERALLPGLADRLKMAFRRAKGDLLAARWIAIEGERVIDLHHRYA